MRSSTIKTIGYWTTTGLLAVPLLGTGVVDTIAPPSAVSILAHLGYPAYFATIIGVWKVLGGSRCWLRACPGSRSGPTPASSSTSPALPSRTPPAATALAT